MKVLVVTSHRGVIVGCLSPRYGKQAPPRGGMESQQRRRLCLNRETDLRGACEPNSPCATTIEGAGDP